MVTNPNVKVSWPVTGIRQDGYANARRIQVEEDTPQDQGQYLHPELFGAGPEQADRPPDAGASRKCRRSSLFFSIQPGRSTG